MPHIIDIHIQKIIKSVKLHISHQMKPYSRVKTIFRFSYTCFNIFGELGQVEKIGPKCPTSLTDTQKVIKSAKLHISHQRSLTLERVKAISGLS